MELDFTIKNYRCFADTKPAQFSIRPRGFTAFVGTNNSGKTTLLKLFYELRSVFQLMSGGGFKQALNGEDLFQLPSTGISDYQQIFSKFNDRHITLSIQIRVPESQEKKTGSTQFPKEIVFTIYRKREASYSAKIRTVNGFIQNKIGDTPLYDTQAIQNLSDLLSKTLYIGPFRNVVNLGTEGDSYDIKVGKSLIKMWTDMKTGRNAMESETAYRVTEDIKRIFRYERFEVNSSSEDDTLQIFINDKSYKLPEVGAGLAHLIVGLANAAKRQPSVILIDEPELNLHPSLQIDFLTTLASYAKYGVIFTTHNIGLARAVADKIYSVRQSENGENEVRPLECTRYLTEFLGELSYSGYKEMGFEIVLLVEGVTEVKTIHQFLRLYKKDHIVLLIPMGGAQLINEKAELELQELTRIPAKFFALIDSEKGSAEEPLHNSRAAFREICQKLRITCRVLERRALENYLTDAAIKAEKGDKYRALEYYESLEKVNPSWAKTENWCIARRMKLQDIKDTDLGLFLASI